MFTDLPRDLESEILSRVPPKSLTKLKTVCRRWYTLFRDPKFIKKNFGNNKTASEVILLMNSRVHSINFNLHGNHSSLDPSIEFTGMLNSQKDPKDVEISEISQCEGLLLCTTNDKRLVVWNPCTGETRWIPYKHAPYHKCLLGYENNNNKSCDSFKILSYFHCYSYMADDEFEIYEFESDSWRSLHDVCPNCSSENVGVTLKGNMYWFAADFKDPVDQFILRFDFTEEKFGRLSLPFERGYADGTVENVVLSVVREEKLALLYLDLDSSEMKIWVTNQIDEAKDFSWSEFVLVVDIDKFHLVSVYNVMSFLLDQENNVAICCSRDIVDGQRTRIDIVGEDIHRELYKDATKGTQSFFLSYVPNLVHIQKNTPKRQKKRKQKEVS